MKEMIRKNKIEIIEKVFFCLFIFYAILGSCSLTYAKPIISIVMWPAFVLGAALILLRTIHWKRYIKMPFLPVLLFFLVSGGFSTLLNYQFSFKRNAIFCIYWAFYFLIFYTIEQGKPIEKIKKDFRFVAGIYVMLISIVVIASFLTFLFGYSAQITTTDTDYTYYIGFMIGRLWGAFLNLNNGSEAAAISSCLLCYFIWYCKKRWFRIAAGMQIFLNVLYIALADSRSGAVCVGVLAFFFTLFALLYKWREKRVAFKGLAVLLASVALVTGYLIPRQFKNAYNATSKSVYQISISNGDENDENENKKPLLIERGYDLSDDISNRRFDVWKSGIEISTATLKNLFFGIGFSGMTEYAERFLPDTYIINNDYGKIPTMDNEFFNVLVAQGVLGVLIIVILIIGVLILLAKNFLQVSREDIKELLIILSVIFGLAGSAMFNGLIFYHFSQSAILFWILLGEMVYLLKYRKGASANATAD